MMGRKKATDEIVDAIRKAARPCSLCGLTPGVDQLALRFGFSRNMIWKIVRRHAWALVEERKTTTGTLSESERTQLITRLQKANISWRSEDDLRLAAEIFALG
jgi:hypothetical protein